MAIHKYQETKIFALREGVERRLAHSPNLMMTIFDFRDGPQPEPDPPHAHPHEQISYVAEGKVNFVMDGQITQVEPGDLIVVPANMPHSIQLLTPYVRLVDCFTPIREDFLA